MTTNLKPLKAVIRLVADAVVDTEKVIESGMSPLVALFTYKNLVPDIIALVPQIGEIPSAVKALAPDDYVALVTEFAKDLAITDAHAGTIVDAGLDLLHELIGVALPKAQVLAAAIKAPKATAVVA